MYSRILFCWRVLQTLWALERVSAPRGVGGDWEEGICVFYFQPHPLRLLWHFVGHTGLALRQSPLRAPRLFGLRGTAGVGGLLRSWIAVSIGSLRRSMGALT